MRVRIPFVTGVVFAGMAALAGCSKEGTPPPASTPTPAATPATTPAATAPAAAPQERVFGKEELDQMVAPIALYPDPLLAQVLMAATYPGEVADAVAWSKAHPDAQGDAAVRQVASESWDASVQSLVAFPQALATLGQDPAWVQKLGDAFLAQPNEVMDAVQRLRRQAQAAGNLESNEYQKVTAQPVSAPAATDPGPAPETGAVITEAAPQQAIIIEPAQPEVVYVPSYDPNTAYGDWAYPSYPPAYYPPPSSYYPMGGALASGLAFGVGLAITDSIWGGFGWDDWGHGGGDVDIDVDRYNNINVNNRIDSSNNVWRHDGAHRDGVRRPASRPAARWRSVAWMRRHAPMPRRATGRNRPAVTSRATGPSRPAVTSRVSGPSRPAVTSRASAPSRPAATSRVSAPSRPAATRHATGPSRPTAMRRGSGRRVAIATRRASAPSPPHSATKRAARRTAPIPPSARARPRATTMPAPPPGSSQARPVKAATTPSRAPASRRVRVPPHSGARPARPRRASTALPAARLATRYRVPPTRRNAGVADRGET